MMWGMQFWFFNLQFIRFVLFLFYFCCVIFHSYSFFLLVCWWVSGLCMIVCPPFFKLKFTTRDFSTRLVFFMFPFYTLAVFFFPFKQSIYIQYKILRFFLVTIANERTNERPNVQSVRFNWQKVKNASVAISSFVHLSLSSSSSSSINQHKLVYVLAVFTSSQSCAVHLIGWTNFTTIV